MKSIIHYLYLFSSQKVSNYILHPFAGEEVRGKGEDPAVQDENPAVVAGDQLVIAVDFFK